MTDHWGMTHSGEPWTLGYAPALDGLRAFSIGLVLVSHAASSVPATRLVGGIGVAVFFTLSGFLITTLLLQERDKRGRYSLLAFYRRRALRLMPALVATIVLAVVLEVALTGGFAHMRAMVAAATYTTNLYVPMLGAWPDDPYHHTWSLAVEEQFYLVWPLLLLGLLRMPRRVALQLVLLGIAGSLCLRMAWYQPGVVGHSYMSLVTRADELLIGASLALWMHGRNRQEGITGRWVLPALALIVASPALGALAPTLAALLTAAVLYRSVQADIPGLTNRVVVWAGQRAYGMYLYNTVILWALLEAGAPGLAVALTLVPLTLVVSAASYRWVEAPFLAKRYGTQRGAPPNPKVVAA